MNNWLLLSLFLTATGHDGRGFCKGVLINGLIFMDLSPIQEKIQQGDYRFSEHAIKRMIERWIDRSDIIEVIGNGRIIEEYPDDKYSPSCLIYGQSTSGRHLHVQASLPPNVVIITTYEPDPDEWIYYSKRR